MTAISMFNQVRMQYTREQQDSKKPDNQLLCVHTEVSVDSTKRKVCLDCHEVLSDCYLVVQPGNNFQHRKKYELTLYRDIPSYLSPQIRNMTIEIYKYVTGDDMYRNIFKKAVLLSCIHRASLLCGNIISLDSLLRIMSLTSQEATKGLNHVTIKIPKNSIYAIPLFENENNIASVAMTLGLDIDVSMIQRIFIIVKSKSNLLNTSHYKSVVCGCIWFWFKITNETLPLKCFLQKVGMAELTVLKKYMCVAEVVFKTIMKQVFCYLLNTASYKPTTRIMTLEKDDLYCPDMKLTVHHYTCCDSLQVITADNTILPLDDVDDLIEWNFLLSGVYYDTRGCSVTPGAVIVQTNKELYINFGTLQWSTHPTELIQELISQYPVTTSMCLS